MSDKLLEDAKRQAAREKRSLNEYIVDAIAGKVYSDLEEEVPNSQFSLPVFNLGTPRADINDNSALLDLLDEEGVYK